MIRKVKENRKTNAGMNFKKKLLLLSAVFILGTVSYGEDTGPTTVQMPSIKDWGIWHTASTGVIQALTDTETAINNHAVFIKKNIDKNNELESRLNTESDNLAAFKNSFEENKNTVNGALNKLELQANENSQKITNVQNFVTEEQEARKQSEKEINNKILQNQNNLQKESSDRIETEKQIISKMENNTSTIDNNASLIHNEKNDRINSEKEINNKISQNQNAIQKEISNRTENENIINSKISQNQNTIQKEISNRAESEKLINSKISENKGFIQKEISNRVEKEKEINNKISENKNNIQSERLDREQSDKNINSKIDANSKKINANTENIKKIGALHDKTVVNENKLQEHDKKLAAYEEQIMRNRAELDNINDKIANLDNKLSRGMSLMAAMTAIDFQDVKQGEIGIGAGMGHFENSQSVALGVAYAPTENIRVNAKYSVSTDSIKTSAIGVGGTFKFKVR